MKMYVYILLALSSISLVATPKKKITQEDDKAPEQCYCSVKCGPRDVGEKKHDTPSTNYKPTNYNADESWPGEGICFCQQNDANLFVKNHCDEKNNAVFDNSYCKNKEDMKKSKSESEKASDEDMDKSY